MYIIETMELLLAAGNAPKIEKMACIKQVNIKFDTLKIFIRLAQDVKMLDEKKYLELQKRIQEIGRMIGGWQKSVNPARFPGANHPDSKPQYEVN